MSASSTKQPETAENGKDGEKVLDRGAETAVEAAAVTIEEGVLIPLIA